MSTLRAPLVAVAAGAVLTLAGCGSSSSSSAPSSPVASATSAAPSSAAQTSQAPPASPVATITINSFAFGQPLTVKAGQDVKVVNEDAAPHTVTADDGTSFNASAAASGGTGSFTAPKKPGRYAFHCTVHPMMHGTLIVT